MSRYSSLLQFDFAQQRRTLALGMPIILSQLLYAIAPFANTLLAARLNHFALAAQALVSMTFFTCASLGWGLLSSVGVLTAHAHGERKPEDIAQVNQQGFCLAVGIGLIASVLIWHAPLLYTLTGQDPRVVRLTISYCHWLSLVMPTIFIGAAIAEFLIGVNQARVMVVLSALEIPLNIALKYALMFGKWGLPQLGLTGLPIGMVIIVWLFVSIYLIYILWRFPQYQFLKWHQQNWHHLKELYRIGWPASLALVIEIAYLAVMNILMGKLGTNELAANQIALQLLGLVTAISFSIGLATTARVGQALGERHFSEAKAIGISGIHLACYFMLFVALVFFALPKQIVFLDLNVNQYGDHAVTHLAVIFLRLSACFVIIDGLRVLSTAILRGYKDTRFAMGVSFLSFWLIGLILGSMLVSVFGFGAIGLWIGLITGITIGTWLLLHRFLKVFYKARPKLA